MVGLAGDRWTLARWDAAGALTELAAPSVGGVASPRFTAVGLDTSGRAYGYGGNDARGRRAFRWDAGTAAATELSSGLGTSSTGLTEVRLSAVNASGLAVGFGGDYRPGGQGSPLGLRWEPGATVATLLSDPADRPGVAVYWPEPRGVNAGGVIVGYARQYNFATGALPDTAVWWDGSGAARDLNAFVDPASGWTLNRATHLTDVGWIGGEGTFDPDGPGIGQAAVTRAFIMLVPEAGTYGRGDANFDSRVNFADLVTLAQNYNRPSNGSTSVGDFNLDGITNFVDLVALAQNYNTGVANVAALGNASLTADWALAQTLVPEPTGLLLAGGLGIGIARRVRRGRKTWSGTRIVGACWDGCHDSVRRVVLRDGASPEHDLAY